MLGSSRDCPEVVGGAQEGREDPWKERWGQCRRGAHGAHGAVKSHHQLCYFRGTASVDRKRSHQSSKLQRKDAKHNYKYFFQILPNVSKSEN